RRRPGGQGPYAALKRGDLVRSPSGPFRPWPSSFGQHSSYEFLYCSGRSAQLAGDFVDVRSLLGWLTRPLKNQLCLLGGPASHNVVLLVVRISTEATPNARREMKLRDFAGSIGISRL